MQGLQNALLIHNPNAGSGGDARRAKVDEARRILNARGIQADLAETTGPGEATAIARRASTDGRITYAVDLELKARLGILAYWWQGAREAFNYKFTHFRVIGEGQSRDVSLVIVGRTKHYGGPFKITTEADLFEDQCEFMGLTSQSGLKYLSYLPTLWFGDLRKEEGVYFWKSDRLVCEPTNEAPIYAQIDGEPLARLPVEFRIVPRALRLLVPGPAQLPSGAK